MIKYQVDAKNVDCYYCKIYKSVAYSVAVNVEVNKRNKTVLVCLVGRTRLESK